MVLWILDLPTYSSMAMEVKESKVCRGHIEKEKLHLENPGNIEKYGILSLRKGWNPE